MTSNPELLRYACTLLFAAGLWFVNYKVNKSELSFTLGVVWSAALALGLTFAVFPAILSLAAAAFGLELPSNFLFLSSILFLVTLCFGLTLKDARHDRKVVVLIQELGLLRQQVDELQTSIAEGGDVRQSVNKLPQRLHR